jgi:hypothetical protein
VSRDEPHGALDVRVLRAQILARFHDLAERVLTEQSGLRSIQLSCAQCWNDEASDAVQSDVLACRDTGATERVSHELEWETLRWSSNESAVHAFAALCCEEGWSEETGTINPELLNIYHDFPSPLMLVQRVNGELIATWLGGLHRPWLDFPGATKAREYRDSVREFVEDPPMPRLEGREPELYAQVLADPTDLGAREVLRDLWMLRDDPRGEFSALSTPRELTAPLRARAADLVLEHGRAWLGSLQAVVPLSGSLFGNGPFLRKAVVYAADAKTFDGVAAAPEWATVEELVFANYSHRALTHAMRNLRAVGPLSATQLGSLRDGAWSIEDLDVEADDRDALDALAELRLPLRHLRIRADRAVDLTLLARAAWWSSLTRIELWLPGSTDEAAPAIARAFHAMAPQLAADCTLAVGQLSAGQRTGWMLAGTASQCRLELRHPDARHAQGRQLAAAIATTLPPVRELAGDDWLTFGLGVSAMTKRA